MLEMPSARTLLAQMRPLHERERSRFSSPSDDVNARSARTRARARACYRDADQFLISLSLHLGGRDWSRELLESVL
jgi:hypothetical protein